MLGEHKKAALLSIGLHVALVVLLSSEISFFEKKKIVIEDVPVTFTHLADITPEAPPVIPKPATEPEPEPPLKKEEPHAEPDPVPEPTPEPQKPPTPEPPAQESAPEPPQPKEIPAAEPKPIPTPKPQKKEAPAPKPEKKSATKKKDKAATKQNKLDELLQKVSLKKKKKATTKTTKAKAKTKGKAAAAVKSSLPPSQKNMLIESVRQQLFVCWNPPQRVRDAPDCKVSVAVTFREDGKVLSAKVLPNKSTTKHPAFKIASKTALSAVEHPSCNPLIMPEKLYQEWKETIVDFSYRD